MALCEYPGTYIISVLHLVNTFVGMANITAAAGANLGKVMGNGRTETAPIMCPLKKNKVV
jgi:hypothetical protein